jgi:endonuclease/exonuclease/phosphatase family metal-dependent hydrolase
MFHVKQFHLMLTICTYNIHAGKDANGAPSLPAIAGALAALAPDLCLLQEVDRQMPRSGWQDQAALLAQAVGGQVHFYGRLRFGPAAYGNAVLSRQPIRKVTYLPLPGGGEPRSAIGVQLDDADGTWVWNTHLGLRPEWRREQLSRLAEALADQPSVLVGGDFNARPHDEEVAAFLQETGLAPLSADAPTFPVPNPTERIDLLLGRGGLMTAETTTTAAPGSDHCLVWARVGRA